MGVLTCSRLDCDGIMCDTYVESVGYICPDCISEFKNFLKETGSNPKTDGQITRKLQEFITIPKYTFQGNEVSVDNFFNLRTDK